ncbi:hypothetical protein HPP92_021366 [Vanilla planifolia]|uniref:Mitochondrial import receptor subunit TOM20 n=1 Tax=Vanilla planifolia TaxID=51239 RepID=A0A835Q0Z3_VANPL|nr:hypothetical protein HPP92_021366 [Vanilla planifolia]
MEFGQQDFERMLFFEQARQTAENLTNWAGALIELSQFQSRTDSVNFVKDAISKLDEALGINPRKHDILWSLGNANTSLGFYTSNIEDAKPYFTKAIQCFKQALDEDPGNQLYLKSLDLASKAPELHVEIHKQMANQQSATVGPSASNTKVLLHGLVWPNLTFLPHLPDKDYRRLFG